MTDIVTAAFLPPYRCTVPGCDRTFDTVSALNAHQNVHRPNRKMPCPECGRMTVVGPGMAAHRKSAHGVQPSGAKATKKPAKKPTQPKPPSRPDLDVDDIFDSVVALLFPRGAVPVTAVKPLIRWREQTAQMLMEIGA